MCVRLASPRTDMNSGVGSIAIRSLAIAAECLVVREEQEEVLQIFDRIRRETGWRVSFINQELKEKWGWNSEEALQQQQQHGMLHSTGTVFQPFSQYPVTSSSSSVPPAPAPAQAPAPAVQMRVGGIMNPLMATADFSSQHHPYQSYYVAPNQHPHQNQYNS